MSEEIIKVLDYIGQQLGIAIDWTSENIWPQILDIFGRYRILQLIYCSLWIVVYIAIIIIFTILWVKVIKAYHTCKINEEDNFWWDDRSYGLDMTGYTFALCAISVFGGIGVIAAFVHNVSEVLQWLLVPEIQFLDLLKGYVA